MGSPREKTQWREDALELSFEALQFLEVGKGGKHRKRMERAIFKGKRKRGIWELMKVFTEKGMDNGVQMLLRGNGKVQQTLVSLRRVLVGSRWQTPCCTWLEHEQEVTAQGASVDSRSSQFTLTALETYFVSTLEAAPNGYNEHAHNSPSLY